jgi:hypothetical protein
MSIKASLLTDEKRAEILLKKTEDAHYKTLSSLKQIVNFRQRQTAIRNVMKNTYKTLLEDEKILENQLLQLIEKLNNVCKLRFWVKESDICIEGLTCRPCKFGSCKFCQQNLLIEEKITILEGILATQIALKQKQRQMPIAGATFFPVLGK